MPDLTALFNPRSIAVVGASKGTGPGENVIRNILTLGFPGTLSAPPSSRAFPGRPEHSPLILSITRHPERSEGSASLGEPRCLLRPALLRPILRSAQDDKETAG